MRRLTWMFWDQIRNVFKRIEKKELTIPHPLLAERKFILKPLSEINPDYIHPVLKKTIKELLLSCKDKLAVTKLQ